MRWHWFLGAPLLLIFSLANLGWHLLEQNHRHHVLAEGNVAQAAVARAPSGLQWVTIEWKDTTGSTRVGTAWTGKPFARRFRDSPDAIQNVGIKYVANSAEVIVLSEAAERERINIWWITADAGMAMIMSILLIFGTLTALGYWRSRLDRS